MTKQLITFCALAVALTGCSKDKESNSKDSDGNCTYSFVSEYNSVVYEAQSAKRIIDASHYSEAEKISQLSSVKNACQNFKSNHSGVSCKAMVDYQEKWISSSDHNSSCNTVNSFFANQNSDATARNDLKPTTLAPAAPIVNPYEHLEGVKVNDAKYDYEFIVKDSEKLLSLLNDSKKFAADGKIYDSRYLTRADRGVLDKTMCIGSNLEQKYLTDADFKNKALTVMSGLEKVESTYQGTNRVLSISINELGVGFGCMKSDSYQDFTWLEVQNALKGIVELKKTERSVAPVTAKVATDSDGYCTPEFAEVTKKMASQSMDFAQKTLDLSVKIMTTTSEQEKFTYEREMTQEGRKIIAMCDDIERTWGEFSCKTKKDDGTDSPVNDSKDFKKSCDQARAQIQK